MRKLYKAQRSRGYEGFGFYSPNSNRLTHHVNERGILRQLKRTRENEILFHHRFPTSTANTRNGCHPYSTKDRWKSQYIGVHNGVLYNDDILAKEQMEKGVSYISYQADGRFNDSEVLIHNIGEYLEGERDRITAQGSIAFIVVKLDESGQKEALYFGRNQGNPLKMVTFKDGFKLTSEGTGENIKPDTMHRYDYATGEITTWELEIPYYSYSYNNYGFYTPSKKKDKLKSYTTTDSSLDRNTRFRWDYTDELEQEAVKDVMDSLRYDTYYSCDEDAAEFGMAMHDELRMEYDHLEMKSYNDELETEEFEEYLELEMKMELLGKAIDKLITRSITTGYLKKSNLLEQGG